MEMRMDLRISRVNEKPAVKKPAEVFQKCPDCRCADLLKVDGDVICSNCDWNSITLYADALFDQGIGFLFESDEAKEKREQEEQRKDREKRSRRLMNTLHAAARVPAIV